MSTFQDKIEIYADIALKVGVNLQKGQTLYISTPLYAAEFVRIIAKKAYQAGAKHVHVEWNDEELTRLKFELASEASLSEFPNWKVQALVEEAENNAAFLRISESGGDPDLLKDTEPDRISTENKTRSKVLSKFRSYTQFDRVSWSIVAVPSVKWAEKVFPESKGKKAVDKLWEALFSATRVNKPNPITAWQNHLQMLDEKMQFLNAKHYHALHFQAKGTDLTIELPETHIWEAGGSVNKEGVNFVANIPTEEVFTAPKKEGVNGTVSSTKPLNYGGILINDFKLTFENGKVISYNAREGEETLRRLLESDEGASYIGEIALVPYRSHISDMNLIFYNTLLDENASTHLALGSAYPINIEGGNEMEKKELEEKGINTSITHVDFMIGTADMSIDGIHKDGTRETIFRNGGWAF
ncbi:aminopeptidase [Oceanobacillus neutriphilus]|uniref:Aminopeptidase n=1 Tax=Oceanobacillus neutriphilus TaxID=531815 RepID=A0ABQ2P0A4_9BACI|nr:aminopeptidase [Oceanobacillus neutriphilus]GGP14998.1 aminopeptidase [Oceanobacillus neutriphilus]